MEEKESNKRKEPWPTKSVMEQIYKRKLWGGGPDKFYSGIGSHHPELVNPYIHAVGSFLSSFKSPLVVCDLACGDFNVGKDLVKYAKRYIAVDIVSDLISFNKQKFKEKQLEFHCLDLAKDDLPLGDCAILRQVLQHLSNKEVLSIVSKLNAYKYLILTEHLPEGVFEANKDIIAGQGTRLKKQSGVDLLAPPFNLKVKDQKLLFSIALKDYPGVIVTTLYKTY